MTPAEYLQGLVARLHSTPNPDPNLIREVGAGKLENLISAHGETLWPEIEHLARTDTRFRGALASVWAYDSPEFDRLANLLSELGEFRTVSLRFVVQPSDYSAIPRLSWRAVELDGEPPGRQLARLLREIADWYEREPLRDNPELATNRSVWPFYYEWSKAAAAVESLWHEVAIAPDLDALRACIRQAHHAKRAEQEAWAALARAVEPDTTTGE